MAGIIIIIIIASAPTSTGGRPGNGEATCFCLPLSIIGHLHWLLGQHLPKSVRSRCGRSAGRRRIYFLKSSPGRPIFTTTTTAATGPDREPKDNAGNKTKCGFILPTRELHKLSPSAAT